MSLLERIANSNGDPQKTIEALRLMNQRLQKQVAEFTQYLTGHVDADVSALRKPGVEIIGIHSQLQLSPSTHINSPFDQIPDLRWPVNYAVRQKM